MRRAYDSFREVQIVGDVTVKEFKKILTEKMVKLNDRLDVYLGKLYGKDPRKVDDYKTWHDSHKPFHWFAEFYDIVHDRGGFDVIIGNPPYVELKSVNQYKLVGYECYDSGNLYALVIERSYLLSSVYGMQGFIVPVSSVSTDRYITLQNLLSSRCIHYSSFDDRPSRLFDGLEHIRLTIHIISPKSKKQALYSERYNKWFSIERPTLFNNLAYANSTRFATDSSLPKLYTEIENSIVIKLLAENSLLAKYFLKNSKYHVYYSRKVGYFLQVLDFEPEVYDGEGNIRPPSEFKTLNFSCIEQSKSALCCLNSNLYYWFTTVLSDCRHVNKREVDCFPVRLEKLAKSDNGKSLSLLAYELMNDIKSNSESKHMKFSHDTLKVQCIYPKKSKPIIDKIDTILAKHYGFTDEELDFIINYDIKYRMGKGAGEEDDL